MRGPAREWNSTDRFPLTGPPGPVRIGLNAGKADIPQRHGQFQPYVKASLRGGDQPTAIEIMPFWATYNDYDDESGTFYLPAGSFVPTIDQCAARRKPAMGGYSFHRHAMPACSPACHWGRVGSPGSVPSDSSVFNRHIFTHLLVDEQPDGTAERSPHRRPARRTAAR